MMLTLIGQKLKDLGILRNLMDGNAFKVLCSFCLFDGGAFRAQVIPGGLWIPDRIGGQTESATCKLSTHCTIALSWFFSSFDPSSRDQLAECSVLTNPEQINSKKVLVAFHL